MTSLHMARYLDGIRMEVGVSILHGQHEVILISILKEGNMV